MLQSAFSTTLFLLNERLKVGYTMFIANIFDVSVMWKIAVEYSNLVHEVSTNLYFSLINLF